MDEHEPTLRAAVPSTASRFEALVADPIRGRTRRGTAGGGVYTTSEVDGVTVIELAHGKANAMDLEFCTGLAALLGRLAAEGSGGVVLTGRGRIFSAGVDLLRLLDGGPAYVQEFLPALSGMARALFEFPRPLIAAVNGHAIAGGCVMACAADVRLLAEGGARMGVPELQVGVPFPAIALEIMREAAAPAVFTKLVEEGALLDGEAAKASGLVEAVVAAEELLARSLERAARLAAIPPDVFALTKRQVRAPALARVDALDAEVGDAVWRIWTSASTFDAVRGYVQRTFKPQG
jgi:enoyl-CoA hydratase